MNKTFWVKAKEWIDIEEVEVTDCSEDVYGRDVVCFEYEGEEYESIVVVGSCPG